MTPTGFEAELRTRKNVGIIGDFAIFNEEIMKKNKAFFILLFSNFSVKKGVKIQTCRPQQVALAPLHIIPDSDIKSNRTIFFSTLRGILPVFACLSAVFE